MGLSLPLGQQSRDDTCPVLQLHLHYMYVWSMWLFAVSVRIKVFFTKTYINKFKHSLIKSVVCIYVLKINTNNYVLI